MPFYGTIGLSIRQTQSITEANEQTGNHDVHPTNAFPRRTSRDGHALDSDWALQLHADVWLKSNAINQKQAEQVTGHGSGSFSRLHPGTNLRIISLNSGYWYKAVRFRC